MRIWTVLVLGIYLLFTCCCILCTPAHSAPPTKTPQAMTPVELKVEFEQRYQKWLTWIHDHPLSSTFQSCDEFNNIIALGPKAVPIIISKIRDDGAWMLSSVIPQITKVRIGPDRWPKGTYGAANAADDIYLQWWDNERGKSKDTYGQLKTKWREIIASGKYEKSVFGQPMLWYDQTVYDIQSHTLFTLPHSFIIFKNQHTTELGQIYTSIKDLGIDVLPLIITDMKNKEYDFMPIFVDFTQCTATEKGITAEKRAERCVQWWELHKDEWTIPEK